MRVFLCLALNGEAIRVIIWIKKGHNILLLAELAKGEEQTSETSTFGLDNCDIYGRRFSDLNFLPSFVDSLHPGQLSSFLPLLSLSSVLVESVGLSLFLFEASRCLLFPGSLQQELGLSSPAFFTWFIIPWHFDFYVGQTFKCTQP